MLLNNKMSIIKKLKYSLVISFSFLNIIACQQDNKPPIDISTMSEIVSNVQFAENYAMLFVSDKNEIEERVKNIDTLSKYYAIIFQHYKITEDQYQSALKWYNAHPELFVEVIKKSSNSVASIKGEKFGPDGPPPEINRSNRIDNMSSIPVEEIGADNTSRLEVKTDTTNPILRPSRVRQINQEDDQFNGKQIKENTRSINQDIEKAKKES